MTILNYFFIGFAFTFFIDVSLYVCRKHPQVRKAYPDWNNMQRFLCMLLWPFTSIFLIYSIIKAGIKSSKK